jgi:hypothetical protein
MAVNSTIRKALLRAGWEYDEPTVDLLLKVLSKHVRVISLLETKHPKWIVAGLDQQGKEVLTTGLNPETALCLLWLKICYNSN